MFTLNSQSQDIHQHKIWNDLLESFVDDQGLVNYTAFKTKENTLDKYLEQLSNQPIQDHWSTNQKKAYLINAYNAFTIKLILKNHPLESIKDIGGLLENPFKIEFAQLGDQIYSLDDIEKGMLLPLGDARVHFAVNCASFSCPKLLNEAYLAENLDQQLEQSAASFINSERNKIEPNQIKLSKIFKWYKSDFEANAGSLIKFINIYSKTKVKSSADINYLDYSWALNQQ